MGGLGCEVLVLMGSFGATTYGRWVVDGDGMSRVGSWSGVGSEAVRRRLRSSVCVVCVW